MLSLLAATYIIPSVGKVFGLRVGVDTIEQLERRLGPGKPFTGGHPRGGRTWVSADKQWIISADGFEYGNGGRLLEGIWFERNERGVPRPIARPVRVGALSAIGAKMTRAQVRAKLSVLVGQWNGDEFSQTGKANVKHATNPYVDHLTRWVVSFSFDNRGLSGFSISAKD